MAHFTLDAIREAADAKFGNLEVELGDGTVVNLLNPLRLSKTKRDEFSAITEDFDEDDADQAEVFAKALKIAATDEAAVDKLVEAVAGDLTVLSEIFSQYVTATQAGEASASQS